MKNKIDKNKRINKFIIWVVSITLVLAIIVCSGAIYLSDYYRADAQTLAAYAEQYNVERTQINGGLTFGSKDFNVGFIFYPGGKVEYTAYEPLMMQLASKGVFCVLLEMPFNLAVLDMNAADGIQEKYPDVERWYIGGHSLGGSMAASYVSSHAEDFNGLVLLGAYSTADLSDTDLDVLCLHGDEDKVMNREKHDGYLKNLPADAIDAEIEGGCHAYFGAYGAQDGDGQPTITLEKQITITVNSIYELMQRGGNYAENN